MLRRAADGGRWIDVRGASMGHTIPSGSRVHVRAAHRPRRGQVWAFVDDEGSVVVHRVVRRAGDRVQLRGDSNAADDAPVDPARLVGRVDRVQHLVRVRPLGVTDQVSGLFAICWTNLRSTARRAIMRSRNHTSRGH